MYRDVVDIVEQAGEHLDTIMIPKVGVPGDVYMVDAMVTQIEAAMGYRHRIGIEALIETTLGMADVEAIATSSDRLEAMHFGVADFAASCRARTTSIGGLNPDYPGDQWHAALSRMLVACRAYGPSTDRSATSTTPTASSSGRGAQPHSDTRASGRSIPRR
jgi:citrate lyase subunit beta/citryl-CoA lyase